MTALCLTRPVSISWTHYTGQISSSNNKSNSHIQISKLKWKHTYKKAIEAYWIRVYICDIKSKKTLKYLYPSSLRIGYTHPVWNSLDSEAEVRKGVIKARILTGCTFFNQIQCRHRFSGKIIDSTCQLCCLDEEDLYYMVTRCPAFHDIRISSVERLKQIVVEQSGGSVWCNTFEN